MDTRGRCANEDKRGKKPKTQLEDMKTSASAVAPENVTSDSQTVNEEEEQRKRNERYMALLKEEQAWKETLSILQAAKPLHAEKVGKVMQMRQKMKGALAVAEAYPEIFTALGGKVNDGGQMVSRLRQSVQELDFAVAAGDNERAILVNFNKLPESNFLREPYLSSFRKLAQKNTGDSLEDGMKELINRAAEIREEAEEKIKSIEDKIKAKHQEELERQGEGA